MGGAASPVGEEVRKVMGRRASLLAGHGCGWGGSSPVRLPGALPGTLESDNPCVGSAPVV